MLYNMLLLRNFTQQLITCILKKFEYKDTSNYMLQHIFKSTILETDFSYM